jgi:hypothetical protein
MSAIEVRPVTTARDRRRFIYLPEALHRDHPRWMPPIYWDEHAYYDRRKNLAWRYCDAELALAWRDGRPVGRVMGIVNRRHNEHLGERTARFASLECPEDPAVCAALLAWVEDWGRRQGMTRIVGPLGFNDQDPEGFLIEGFEHEPTIVTYYNFPFLPTYLEAAGYAKDVDYVVYRVPVLREIPELIHKVAERTERRGFREVRLRSKRHARQYMLPVLRLMNETFLGIYGYSALDDDEIRALALKFLPLLDVRFVKIVEKDGEVVGFMIGIPNMYEGIVRARGRLFPFGFVHILRSAKRATQLDLLLGGVKEKYRGTGVDMLMGREMLRSANAAGFTVFDSHHELESNTRVRAEMERWGGEVYKRFRIYHKAL